MTLPPASLIVVSRHRPRSLLRTLAGVAQMDHPGFEVIVVACPDGARAARAQGIATRVVDLDAPGVGAARNAGLARAAAPVVAFLDDDAVPEPTWLSRLVAPFADGRVTQAGGYVRGRSGLAWQWRAIEVDSAGRDHPLPDPGATVLRAGDGRRAVKTQGTNCAFRADALRAAGGFDPALRFYLDEACVNLRLAARGGLTAIVPGAVVHHGFAASALRRADRVPRDLTEIGASIAVFLRRHAPPDPLAARAAHRAEQRARLIRHMVSGGLEPRDLARLMAGFEAGLAQGAARDLPDLPPLPAPAGAVLAALAGTGPRPGLVIAARPWSRRAALAQARAAVAAGRIVTMLTLHPGLARHRLAFRAAGFWEQAGGVWGRGDRDAPRPRALTLAARVAHETARLSAHRPVTGEGPPIAPETGNSAAK